jgi:hypothetical protein
LYEYVQNAAENPHGQQEFSSSCDGLSPDKIRSSSQLLWERASTE